MKIWSSKLFQMEKRRFTAIVQILSLIYDYASSDEYKEIK